MHTVSSLSELPALGIDRVTVACGVFDGVHLGHRAVLDAVVAAAREADAAPVVLTFSPHPQQVIRPDQPPPPRLVTPAHRDRLFAACGIHAVVVVPFTRELMATAPESFIASVLMAPGCEVVAVGVGSRWRFGYRASGDVALLQQEGKRHGFAVAAIAERPAGDVVVSSTLIRAAVERGDLAHAQTLLGRRFSVHGRVIPGRRIGGRVLGFATANVALTDTVRPPEGIYAAYAVRDRDGGPQRLAGAAYLGRAPTFDSVDTPAVVEIHIFDFTEDLYGQEIEVEYVAHLRGDATFDSTAALQAQIAVDIAAARARLAADNEGTCRETKRARSASK
jgi:riboflavin kinase/FMN adenylyltransferase